MLSLAASTRPLSRVPDARFRVPAECSESRDPGPISSDVSHVAPGSRVAFRSHSLTCPGHEDNANEWAACRRSVPMPFQLDRINGSIPPLFTPFKNGEVDYDTYARMIEHQIKEGSHGIL